MPQKLVGWSSAPGLGPACRQGKDHQHVREPALGAAPQAPQQKPCFSLPALTAWVVGTDSKGAVLRSPGPAANFLERGTRVRSSAMVCGAPTSHWVHSLFQDQKVL